MVDDSQLEALTAALQAKKLLNVTYTKSDGTTETLSGGMYEIGNNKKGNPGMWLWVDSPPNPESRPGIRNLLFDRIDSFEVLDTDFIPSQGFPIKLWGAILE
jgi:hypothetical protein